MTQLLLSSSQSDINPDEFLRSTVYVQLAEPILHVCYLPELAAFVFALGWCYGCDEREIKFLTIRTISVGHDATLVRLGIW